VRLETRGLQHFPESGAGTTDGEGEGGSSRERENQTGRSCFRRLLSARPAGSSLVAWV
jgi:hypothetical protein